MPLQETRGTFEISEDGTFQPGCPILYYQPFSTTDLLSWKQHTPSYPEKPQAMTDLPESSFRTHQPTWNGCRQLLLTFFNTEEDAEFCQTCGGGSKDKRRTVH